MTPLAQELLSLIRAEGPIPFAHFMAQALGHPKHGYYMTRDPFGAGGDFITAPEISQMFGELVGLWLADCWDRQGRPAAPKLVELGPGRGTLMADILRSLDMVPALKASLAVHFVETSPVLRAAQQARVPDAHWHDSLDDVPAGPLFLVANEFFDALPVHVFDRSETGWTERHVAAEGDTLIPAMGPPSDATRWIAAPLHNAAPGSVVEVGPIGLSIMAEIARRLQAGGGAALVVDYGHTAAAVGETVQAMRNHGYVDLLADPGDVDLTAHVDFSALAGAAAEAGATTHGPLSQGVFLERLGIAARAQILGRPEDALRLTDRSDRRAMGALFKCLAVTGSGAPVPAGFEPRV